MGEATGAGTGEPIYVRVQDVAYQLRAGCRRTFEKHLLTTERLEVRQILIQGGGLAEGYAARAKNQALYVLAGTAMLTRQHTEVGPGQLLVIPAGVRWQEQLSASSDELVLLEISRAGEGGAANGSRQPEIVVIRPEDVAAYSPAGHAKTQNRCLFVDDYVEIIEGMIERGGGAERHAHRDHEQLLYVLSGAGIPLLIHYAKGVPHGTGGGIAQPLHLLVVYSPPLGESQNALA